jgi:ABC-2 type transport system ATP-binding protein
VDVQTRHAIIDYLKQLNKEGTTLIYTSHQLAEAEGLCEQIALVDKGEIVREGKLDSLLEEYGHQDLEELFLNLTGKDYRN